MTRIIGTALSVLAAIALSASAAAAEEWPICVNEQTIWVNGNPVTIHRTCIPPQE